MRFLFGQNFALSFYAARLILMVRTFSVHTFKRMYNFPYRFRNKKLSSNFCLETLKFEDPYTRLMTR